MDNDPNSLASVIEQGGLNEDQMRTAMRFLERIGVSEHDREQMSRQNSDSVRKHQELKTESTRMAQPSADTATTPSKHSSDAAKSGPNQEKRKRGDDAEGADGGGIPKKAVKKEDMSEHETEPITSRFGSQADSKEDVAHVAGPERQNLDQQGEQSLVKDLNIFFQGDHDMVGPLGKLESDEHNHGNFLKTEPQLLFHLVVRLVEKIKRQVEENERQVEQLNKSRLQIGKLELELRDGFGL